MRSIITTGRSIPSASHRHVRPIGTVIGNTTDKDGNAKKAHPAPEKLMIPVEVSSAKPVLQSCTLLQYETLVAESGL